MRTNEIISDEEINAHHFGCFGGTECPRKIVNEGVLKAALGYPSGSTVTTILRSHRVISQSDTLRLTKKGQRYLRAIFYAVDMRSLLQFAESNRRVIDVFEATAPADAAKGEA